MLTDISSGCLVAIHTQSHSPVAAHELDGVGISGRDLWQKRKLTKVLQEGEYSNPKFSVNILLSSLSAHPLSLSRSNVVHFYCFLVFFSFLERGIVVKKQKKQKFLPLTASFVVDICVYIHIA